MQLGLGLKVLSDGGGGGAVGYTTTFSVMLPLGAALMFVAPLDYRRNRPLAGIFARRALQR